MTGPAPDLAVIGLGNVLRGDDAIGVRVVEGLRAVVAGDPHALPASTRLVDGGTLGLELLRSIRDTRAVVLVDAARLGGPVGTVSVLRGEDIDGSPRPPDANCPGPVGELVAVARMLGWLPADLALVGIEVADTGVGVGMSSAVTDALPVAMEAVRIELDRMDLVPASGTPGDGATTPLAGVTA
jgi:hydrogenase maturation protease